MNQFKKCKVVMLSSNKSKISFYDNILVEKRNSPFEYKKDCVINPQNIYIISEDTIQIYDFILDIKENKIYQVEIFSKSLGFFSGKTFCFIQDYHKKIISTTDRSLKHDFNIEFANIAPTVQGNCCPYSVKESYLPQPSQQFIEKYIEEYNKGNVITDILVEYEKYKVSKTEWFQEAPYICKHDAIRLKVNSKDNTIIIKKVKELWTREEFIELINKFNNIMSDDQQLTQFGLDKWIEKNL